MPTLTLEVQDDEIQEVLDFYHSHMERMEKIEKTQQQMMPLLKALLDAINKTQNKIDIEDNWWLRCTHAEAGQAEGCRQ